MTIYILFEGVDYEGEKVVGVYDSLKKALISMAREIGTADYRENSTGEFYRYVDYPDAKNYKTSCYLRIEMRELE